jgi:type IV secretory pathway TraG/TraD family ATPase VirD4
VSVSENEMGRDLLSPDELQKLDKNKLVIMVAQANPILAKKILYFKSKLFKSRLLPPVKYLDVPSKPKDDWSDMLVSNSYDNANSSKDYGVQDENSVELESNLNTDFAENIESCEAVEEFDYDL